MDSKKIEYLENLGYTFETLAEKLEESWKDVATLQKVLKVISEDDCFCVCSDRLPVCGANAGFVVPYKMCRRKTIDSIKSLNINLRDESREDYLEGCEYIEGKQEDEEVEPLEVKHTGKGKGAIKMPSVWRGGE